MLFHSKIVCRLLAHVHKYNALRKARTQKNAIRFGQAMDILSSPHHRSLWVALIFIIKSSRLDQFESSLRIILGEWSPTLYFNSGKPLAQHTNKLSESRGSYVKLTDVSRPYEMHRDCETAN